jgi:hypothetical protein
MKVNRFFLVIIGLFGLLMSACHECGDGHDWILYVQNKDSITVEYPVTVFENHLPVACSRKVNFESVDLQNDSVMGGNCWAHGNNYTNMVTHVYRKTAHEDINILFIHYDLVPYYYYDIETGINYHVLDSLMDLYGTTMTVDQDQLTVPLSVPDWAWAK